MTPLLLLFGFLLLLPTDAHAYFDPGAGVVMLQVLIAAGLGVLFRFRAWLVRVWRALLRLFRQ